LPSSARRRDERRYHAQRPDEPICRTPMMLRHFAKVIAGRLGAPTSGIEAEVNRIKQLRIFDHDAYRKSCPDVAIGDADLIRHYVTTGINECRNPCAFFDTGYYLETNPDVAKAGLNPLLHYVDFGWREGRNPSADFDGDWYRAAHLDGEEINPLLHYLAIGCEQGLETRPVMDPAYETLRASGLFDADYYREQYPDIEESGADPVRHYLEHGAREGRNPCACFDTAYYLKHNRDVAHSKVNPLLHFCEIGWLELRNPNPEFDVWWYWTMHLDPARTDVNPLAHYRATGTSLQLSTRPAGPVSQLPGTGWQLPKDGVVKRLCLFAAYDPDGLVDPTLIAYLRELSRFADIHLLADCEMQPGELEKLSGIVVTARAERHGEYDFGSYSRLVRQVGWHVIEQYDELLLANDSCYLLRELDHVFERMDARPCDWWGMQATKGMSFTRNNASNRFLEPIPLEAVRYSLLDAFERDYQYDFHVGSYFLAFRQPVVRDAHFRKLLESVVAQDSKRTLILKYEVGLTRQLIACGFAFETFIPDLYPFHPIYTNWYFQLLDAGFPFLKRYFLANNHYRIRKLSAWKENVLRKLPNADVESIELHLLRVAGPEKLNETLHIGGDRMIDHGVVLDQLLEGDAFTAADCASPKYGHWWAFPVCAFTGVFSGNERAVFEQVKHDPSIKKIVLTREEDFESDGVDVEIVPLQSPRGQYLLMRSGQIFIKHSPTRNLLFPLATHLHNIINLWHGIPLKRIGHASLDMHDNRRAIMREHLKCRAVISSSKVDTLAMASAFYPLSYGDVWPTGLPRNDFIMRNETRLPDDMQSRLTRLRELLAGRRMLLFMPTFRNAQDSAYYRFTEQEVEWLGVWLQRNNVVLGLREHMADSVRTYTDQLAPLRPLDLSDQRFPDAELLYRETSLLVTDYSSCFIDYMLTGRPAISFAYDYDSYVRIERGLFYNLEFAFPGPVCRSFSQLQVALEAAFHPPDEAQRAVLAFKQALFFDHVDDRNAERLVARVKQLADLDDIGTQLTIRA
jgi:CDP-glycerol glycerophosphotransferase (TagB/SpsB family)